MSLLKTETVHSIQTQEAPSLVADVVAAFFRGRRMILAGVLTFLLLATAVIMLVQRTYEARMVFLVRNEGLAFPSASFEDHLEPQFQSPSDTQIGTEIELLSGDDLHRQVISALHPGLSSAAIDHKLLSFNKNLQVLPVPKASLITVTYTGSSPEVANAALAALGRLYLEYRTKIRGNEGAYKFFDQQATHYSQKLQDDQAQLADFSQKYQVTLMTDEKDVIMRRLADARALLYDNEASLGEAQKRTQAMSKAREALPARVVTQLRALPDQAGAEHLNAILVDLQNERVDLLIKYHPTDRHVQELDDKIANIREALKHSQQSKATEEQSDLNPLRQSVDADLQQSIFRSAGLQARQRTLTAQVDAYEAKLQQLNEVTAQYDDLTRKIKDDETSYDLYSKKREQARIDRTLDNDKIANVRQVSGPATVPQSKLSLALSVGCIYIIGTLLIVGLGILAGLWSPRFHSPWELEAAVDSPVLATIPMLAEATHQLALPAPTVEGLPFIFKASESMQTTLFMQILGRNRLSQRDEPEDGAGGANKGSSRSAGAYLSLIGRLRKIEPSHPGGGAVFAVTACTRGEGVTHFVQGLGAELAKYTGKRVAVVEAPDTYESDIPCTDLAPHPLQAGSTGSGEEFLKQWFRQLRVRHDYVLIDCPALSESHAVTVLGPQSDGVVLVVGAGETTRIQLRGGLTMLQRASVPVIGMALNKRRYPVPEAIYNLL